MANNFLAQLEAQPWFAPVAKIFENAGVPAPIWESTIAVEDPSLDPYAANIDPSTGDNSHGLFQINIAGTLAEDGARVAAALGSPEQQAQFSASAMGAAVASLPSGATLAQQLQAVENAGWPGDLSQDAQRQAALQSITSPSAPSGSAVGAAGNAINNAASTVGSVLTNGITIDTGIPQALQSFASGISTLAQNAGIVAIGLALVAAGGVILASPSQTVKDAGKDAAKLALLA